MTTEEKKKDKSNPHYSEDASIRLISVLYDPLASELCKQADIRQEALLLSLTRVDSSIDCHRWASKITQDAAMAPKRTWSLDKVYRVSYLLLARSKKMQAFMSGIGIAGVQASAEEGEGEGEEKGW